MFEKQKDKPDPDVLLEMASYYDVSLESMNKRLMDVSVFYMSSKHYIGVFWGGEGGRGEEGEKTKEEGVLPNPAPFSPLPQVSKKT